MSEAAQSLTGAAVVSAGRLSPARAAGLLAELQLAHRDLLAALAALEDVTSSPRPDAGRYPNARWRLSLASRKRRTVTTAACTELLQVAPPDEAAALARLKTEEASRLAESASHVRRWSLANIAADWAGYCSASASLRSSMRTRIVVEQAVLYPLLEKYSR